jgi:hypothetical protein
MTSKQAIERSASHNEIVTLDFDADLIFELTALCDDWIDTSFGVTEFWGPNWRVHIKNIEI